MGLDGRFIKCIVAFGASIGSLYFSLKSIIMVDDICFKGKNMGIMFVTMMKDDNKEVFPLAYGVGLIENDLSRSGSPRRFDLCMVKSNRS